MRAAKIVRMIRKVREIKIPIESALKKIAWNQWITKKAIERESILEGIFSKNK